MGCHIRIGGGTRLKIFEAMAMAKAVVSTSVGAEGLPVTNGRDVDLADEPSRFAQTVVRLMRDAGARHAMETAARRLVVERYDWSAVALDFERAVGEGGDLLVLLAQTFGLQDGGHAMSSRAADRKVDRKSASMLSSSRPARRALASHRCRSWRSGP